MVGLDDEYYLVERDCRPEYEYPSLSLCGVVTYRRIESKRPLRRAKPTYFEASRRSLLPKEKFADALRAVNVLLMRPWVRAIVAEHLPRGGFELLPAVVLNRRAEYEGYTMLRFWKHLDVWHRERSRPMRLEDGSLNVPAPSLGPILDTLSLDEDRLGRLPLAQRQVFILDAPYLQRLVFHRLVVERLLARGLRGVLCVPLPFWHRDGRWMAEQAPYFAERYPTPPPASA